MSRPWAHVPPSLDHPREVHPVARFALVLWIAVVGPTSRASSLPATSPDLALAVTLVGAVVVTVLPARWWAARLGVAVAASAVVYDASGKNLALWVGYCSVLAAWAALERPPLPGLRPPVHAELPVAVLVGVAIWQGSYEYNTWQPFVPLALAGLVTATSSIGNGALHRAGEWLGEHVASWVAALVFSVLHLIAVIVPWGLQRTLRLDPLATRPGWLERDRRPLRASEPWTEDPVTAPRPGRWRGPAAVAVVGLVALGVVWMDRRGGDELPDVAATGPGLADAPEWYGEYQQDIAWVLDEDVALQPFETYRVWDVETRHVNVVDGRRATWTAPPCDCRRLRLWMYGGSAVFGLEQRDEHTIASELARLAAADGIVLDVDNNGLPSQLHDRNAIRFGWDLANLQAPDLVLFYDGADEVDSAIELEARGLGDTRGTFEPYLEDLYDELAQVGDPTEPGNSVRIDGWPKVSDAGDRDPGALAVIRYERARSISRALAEQADLPAFWFWQPTVHDLPEGADRPASLVDPERAEAFASAADALPDEVVDLTGAFDDATDVDFATEANHDEEGAALVAAAIYEQIRPTLLELSDPRGAS